jgi:DNA-binding response OmpR family regulator
VPVVSEFVVLLVDCNPTHLAALCASLTAAGYAVVPCSDFHAGKQYLGTKTPNALVTDLRLGSFNGLHLVLIAAQHEAVPTMVVYSGRDDDGMRREALLAGASYLEKPTLNSSLVPHLARYRAAASGVEQSMGDSAGAAPVAVARKPVASGAEQTP